MRIMLTNLWETAPLVKTAQILLYLQRLGYMKTRLLVISILAIFFTAFANAVNGHCPDQKVLSEIIAEHVSDQELSSPEQKLLLPRQSNFASQSQSRTISKRPSTQRNSYRYTIYISGKPVDSSNVKTYQHIAGLFPTGLCESDRFFISLNKLII